MSGKLDQSLDEILSTQRRSAGPRRRNPRRSVGRPTPAAPVGGVHKASKPVRQAVSKTAPGKGGPASRESKIIVSNLPKDVSEQQIKEYFIQSVGPIKKVEISYGPNSQSRGIANVTFHDANGASNAFKNLNGLLVDSRPIKIEIVVGAAQAAKVIPAVKTLAERTSQPKSQPKAQPKSAATDKHNTNAAKGAAGGRGGKKTRGRGGAAGRSARPAKKTAEELDSEMADYFDATNNNENATGSAPAAASGDAPMEDEIL